MKMLLPAILSVWFALSSFAPCAIAQSDRMGALREASKAADKGDLTLAASLLQPYADQGDALAQNLLGGLYLSGGKDFPQDYAKALVLFRKAAEKGNGSSQRHLAIAYEKGQGVAPDPVLAQTWYLKAANRGDALAQFVVAKKCVSGDGVPQDYVEAYKWLTLAMSGLAADSSKAKLDEVTTYRASIASKMTPAQIGEAQKLVRAWSAH